MSPLLCFAHRGASGYEPENTLLSFEAAIEMNTQWIELDVHSIMGFLLVIHDDTLERTTKGFGSIYEQPLAYIRSLDAGDKQRIPLLREVFNLVGQRAGINIELKGRGISVPLVKLIREFTVCKGWSFDNLLVSSFNYEELREIHRLEPELKLGILVDESSAGYYRVAEEIEAYSIHPDVKMITAKFVTKAHKRGMKVYPYVINAEEQMAEMEAMGVDGIFSDYPDRVASWNARGSSITGSSIAATF